jgi:hypothetical protein
MHVEVFGIPEAGEFLKHRHHKSWKNADMGFAATSRK